MRCHSNCITHHFRDTCAMLSLTSTEPVKTLCRIKKKRQVPNKMKSLLSVREGTKHCENWKTNSPRNHWDHEIIWKHDPSRPTHSFQCGNSWFFLSTHREWQKLYELDMESMKWAEVKKLESAYGYYTAV